MNQHDSKQSSPWLELVTGVVDVVEVLLEAFPWVLPWGVRRQQQSLVVIRDTRRLGHSLGLSRAVLSLYSLL